MNQIRNLPRDRSGILFNRELREDVFKRSFSIESSATMRPW
jgi:hypothetical protein